MSLAVIYQMACSFLWSRKRLNITFFHICSRNPRPLPNTCKYTWKCKIVSIALILICMSGSSHTLSINCTCWLLMSLTLLTYLRSSIWSSIEGNVVLTSMIRLVKRSDLIWCAFDQLTRVLPGLTQTSVEKKSPLGYKTAKSKLHNIPIFGSELW